MKQVFASMQASQVRLCRLLLCYCSIALLVLLYFSVLIPVSNDAQANYVKKNVLVLHSYHKGYLWTDDITEGVGRILSSDALPVNVQYEYMDSKKICDEIYIQKIVDLYRYKFKNIKFDAIISSDDNAFNFLRDHREQLFPGTPVIFCATNYMTIDRMAELPNSTGVNESVSLKGNFELILQLHPKATPLAVVTDVTTTGMRIKQRFDEIKPGFHGRAEFVLLQDLTKEELVTRLNHLPDTAVVLYTIFLRDRKGVFLEYDESIDMVVSASPVPVYVTWDFSMGSGAIGGLLTSGIAQGEMAARLALQVLGGQPADRIPFIKESPNKYMFDHNTFQHFGIDSRLFPPASLILNQPDEFYEKYRKLIWQSISGGVVLILIILLLTTNILRRRRAEALLTLANEELEERVRQRTQELSSTNAELTESNDALIDSEERYHSLSDAAFEGILLTEKNIVIEANDTFCRMLGYKQQELQGKEAIDLVPQVDRADVESKILSGYEKPFETSCLRKDGSIFPIEVHTKMFTYKGQQVRVAAIRDLTEKKNAEKEIQSLKGIIPICMHCKGIRDDKGYWNKLEQFILEHSGVEFSHGICNKCMEKYYPEDKD